MIIRFMKLGVLTLLVTSMTASAQPSSNAATTSAEDKLKEARILFDSAMRDKKDKNFSAACPKFDTALELVPSHLNTAIAAAQCYHDAGSFIAARNRYLHAKEVAALQPTQNVNKLNIISEGLAAVTARISYLKVHVLGPVGSIDGVSVSLDGAAIARSNWGTEIPIDRGTYGILATAPGKLGRTITVNIDAEGKTFEVTLDKLESSQPAVPFISPKKTLEQPHRRRIGTTPLIPRIAVSTPAIWQIQPTGRLAPENNKHTGASRAGGVALMLLGGGLLASGSLLAKEAVAQNDAISRGSCGERCNDMQSELQIYTACSVAGFVGGTVSFLAGLTFATATPTQSDKTPPSKSPTVALRFGPNQALVEGQW